MSSPLPPLPNAFLGSLVADSVAMPVHWYYDREAIDRDYGAIEGYREAKSPHPDSILWRSSYVAPNEKGEILHDQAAYWGKRGIHYHQFLHAGENTLNQQLAVELAEFVLARGGYDPAAWCDRYIEFMRTPGRHRDTYVEEYHRIFFTNLARGVKPLACGGPDVHIGGLVPVPAIVAVLAGSISPVDLRSVVQAHVGLTHKDAGVLAAADALVKMLLAVAGGTPLRESILEHGSAWISKAKLRQWEDHADRIVVGRILSPACYIPDAFPASLFLAWRHAGDFRAGVCANASVGGDNCHRGAVVGSLLGVAGDIPTDLVDGLAMAGRVRACFDEPRTQPIAAGGAA
jgi:ADP-ribosyl-[dinitrogen reductase] hydrolase